MGMGRMANSQQSFKTGHITKFFLAFGWIPSCVASRVILFSFCLFLWVLSNHWRGWKKLHILRCLRFTLVLLLLMFYILLHCMHNMRMMFIIGWGWGQAHLSIFRQNFHTPFALFSIFRKFFKFLFRIFAIYLWLFRFFWREIFWENFQ